MTLNAERTKTVYEALIYLTQARYILAQIEADERDVVNRVGGEKHKEILETLFEATRTLYQMTEKLEGMLTSE